MDTNVRTAENIRFGKKTPAWRAIAAARAFVMPYADVFYFLFLAFLMWNKSTYMETTENPELFFYIAAGCLAVKYIFTNWRPDDILKSVALISFGAVTYIISGHTILMVTLAGIVGAKDVNLKRTLGMCLALRIALYIFVVSFANMNMIPSVNRHSESIVNGVSVAKDRYSLGFTMPNAAHVIFLVTAVLYIAANYKKFGLVHAVVIIFIDVILYNITDCRAGFVILIIVVVLALLFKIDKVYKTVGRGAPYLCAACALVSFAFAALYGKVGLIDRLDTILSRRFSYSQLFLNTFGLSPLGVDASSLVSGSQVMDVAYVNLVVNYGIVAFALVMLTFTALAYKSYREGDKGLTVAYIAMALLGMVENYTLDIGINFTVMFAAELLFPPEKEKALFLKKSGGFILK